MAGKLKQVNIFKQDVSNENKEINEKDQKIYEMDNYLTVKVEDKAERNFSYSEILILKLQEQK